MKIRNLLVAVLLLGGLTALNAQPVAKGDKVLNLGLGLGSSLYSGSYYKSTLPPVSASLEFIVKDDLFGDKGALGLGGYAGFSGYKYDYLGWGYKYTNIIIGPRGYLHYNFLDKLDTYTGLLIGYNIVKATEFGTASSWAYNASSSRPIWSWFIGGRYFFSDNFAGMVELGYGIAYLNIGVALKF